MFKPFANLPALAGLGLVVAACAFTKNALAIDVIHDAGNAVPSAQYLGQLFALDTERSDNTDAHPPGLKLVTFPVRSPAMHVGVPPAGLTIKHPEWVAQPVFLLGADATSQRWLKASADRLKAMGAIGIVVDVDNYTAFRQLQQIVPDLMMAPASAVGIDASLGVAVYPVLVLTDGRVTP